MKLLSFVLIALIFAVGCAPKVPGLYVKEDFTGPQLVRGEMVAGGIVTQPGPFDLQESEELNPIMIQALRSARTYLTPQPAARLRDALGDERYRLAMDQFAKADLTGDTLKAIATALPNVRYLTLARIEENSDGGTYTRREDKRTTAGIEHYVLYVGRYRRMIASL